MTGWRDVSIEDLCVRVTSGGTPSRKRPEFFDGGAIPWVKSQELVEARVSATEEHITEAGLKGSSAKILQPDTVLMAMYGANIGQLGWLGIEATVNQAICAMVTDPSVTDSRFLYYALAGARGALIAKAHGAAQQNLSQQLIKPFALRVPDVEIQRQIGAVLRSLDNLIENNRRRVTVLEEMARAIYQQWFLKFRYPGHEDVPLVDSTLGPIPEEWRVVTLGEVARVVRGRSYRSAELADEGGLPFVNLKCMARGGGFRRDGLKRYTGQYKEDQLVGAGDLVLAVTDLTQGREILARATLVPRLSEGKGVISLDVVRLIPADETERLWIFASLAWSNFADRVKEFANGSTVLHLSPNHVVEARTLWPPEPLRKRLANVIDPMLRQIDELSDQAESLAGLRDLLLPKLVTGQIDVSTLDLDALVEDRVA